MLTCCLASLDAPLNFINAVTSRKCFDSSTFFNWWLTVKTWFIMRLSMLRHLKEVGESSRLRPVHYSHKKRWRRATSHSPNLQQVMWSCNIILCMQKDLFCLTSSGNVDLIIHISWMLRKPADRLGKVVFANEVSIGGVGGGGCPGGPKSRYWNFSGGHVPLGNLVTVGFDSP